MVRRVLWAHATSCSESRVVGHRYHLARLLGPLFLLSTWLLRAATLTAQISVTPDGSSQIIPQKLAGKVGLIHIVHWGQRAADVAYHAAVLRRHHELLVP